MLQLTCSLPSSPSITKFITSHPHLKTLETNCTTMRDLHQIHSQIIKSPHLSDDPIALSRLLNFCCTTSPSGDLNYAFLLLSRTPNPTSFMFNSLIRALSKSSAPHSAFSLFHLMRLLPCSPTLPQLALTFPSLFTASAYLNSPSQGAQLHSLVLKLGLTSDTYVHNAMISMYATCGCLTEASRLFDRSESFELVAYNSMIIGLAKMGLIDESRHLFDGMSVRNLITWSSMISGYVRNGMNSDALNLFAKMQAEKMEPNMQVAVSLLRACASLGALEQGEWIHSYIRTKKLDSNVIVTTSIIDMYSKCGSLEKALQMFSSSRNKGLSTWNAMISGLAIHGHGRDAIRLFRRLRSSHLRPDSVSFIAVLTACNHSGLVDEALRYVKLMMEEYGIEPLIEHYGCLVDVLCRAGRVREAEELIGRMEIEPDVKIWGMLLSGCRESKEMEIGRRALSRIVEIDPWDSGGYVMVSNGYSLDGDFGGAVRVRGVMKERGVRKERGGSLIEVGGCVHEFVAGGVMHPETGEILRVLGGLVLNMREGSWLDFVAFG